MGEYEVQARDQADVAAGVADETKDDVARAIGSGLSAVANAVLELADQLGDLRRIVMEVAERQGA